METQINLRSQSHIACMFRPDLLLRPHTHFPAPHFNTSDDKSSLATGNNSGSDVDNNGSISGSDFDNEELLSAPALDNDFDFDSQVGENKKIL